MFVFVRCQFVKSNIFAKIFIAICILLVAALTFTACKDKTIYAENSDFESYPDYWNDFNNGDLYVPEDNNSSGAESDNEDWTANLGDDDTSSTPVDTDNDGKPNTKDRDIDGDGVKNEDDTDIDGDGIPNDKDDDIDGDDIPNEGDTDPDGTSGNKSDTNEGPFVPFN